MNPLISIIIPTYNRAEILRDTLNSLITQSYTNWECIIVDDGSNDSTEEMVTGFSKMHPSIYYFKRPDHLKKGPNSCRNFGFEKSKGDFIKWFDSDDIMYPNLLEKQIESFSENVDMSVCKLEYFNFDDTISIKENIIYSDNLIEDYIVGKITFYTFTPMWRRSFLEKQDQLFDEEISNLDDWDFNLRMLYQKINIAYVNEVLVKYRVHSESLSQKIGKLDFEEIKSEFRARDKHLKLLKNNKIVNPNILKKFINDRYKYILRNSLLVNHPQKNYFFKMLLSSQINLSDIGGFLKTILGFSSYSIFKKGYKFLK